MCSSKSGWWKPPERLLKKCPGRLGGGALPGPNGIERLRVGRPEELARICVRGLGNLMGETSSPDCAQLHYLTCRNICSMSPAKRQTIESYHDK